VTLSLSPAGPFALGDTTVTLTVTGTQGATAACQALVSVVDATPPALSVSLTPELLWPPITR